MPGAAPVAGTSKTASAATVPCMGAVVASSEKGGSDANT